MPVLNDFVCRLSVNFNFSSVVTGEYSRRLSPAPHGVCARWRLCVSRYARCSPPQQPVYPNRQGSEIATKTFLMKNLNPRFVIYVFILIVLLPASVNRMQGSVGASKAGRSRNLVAPIEAGNVLKMLECTFFFFVQQG